MLNELIMYAIPDEDVFMDYIRFWSSQANATNQKGANLLHVINRGIMPTHYQSIMNLQRRLSILFLTCSIDQPIVSSIAPTKITPAGLIKRQAQISKQQTLHVLDGR